MTTRRQRGLSGRRANLGADPDAPSETWHLDGADFSWVPERRLMLAVLQDAIVVLDRNTQKPSTRRPWLVREVEAWMASDTRSHPFAFATICDVLGLDVDCVRKALRTRRGGSTI